MAEARNFSATSDTAATTVKLKALVRKYPNSGEGKFLLGQHLLRVGKATEALQELERARALKFNPNELQPVLARARLMNAQYSELIKGTADLALTDPAAQAELKTVIGTAYFRTNNLKRAQAEADEALASQPGNVSAKLLLVQVAARQGRIPAAIALARSVVEQHAGSADAWAILGELLVASEADRQEGMAALRKALALDSLHLRARMSLATRLLSDGKLSEAAAEIATLKKNSPALAGATLLAGHLALSQGQPARARAEFQALLKGDQSSTAILLGASEAEFQLGGYELAETLVNKALLSSPNDDQALRLLARIQVRKGQPDRAFQTIAPLIARTGAAPADLALAANVASLAGDASTSRSLYRRLSASKPRETAYRILAVVADSDDANVEKLAKQLNSIAHDDTGVTAELALLSVYQREREYERALQVTEDIRAKLPSQALPYLLRAQVLQQKGDATGARESLERGLGLQPGHAATAIALSDLDMAAGHSELARKRYADLIRLQPNNVSLLLSLSELNRRSGASDEDVRKPLELAVRANPLDPAVRRSIVARYMQNGDTRSALAAANAAVAAMPNDPGILDLLGRTQFDSGQRDQALATYGRVTTHFPNLAIGPIGMARIHLAQGDAQEALRRASRAAELESDNVDAYSLRVAACLKLGLPDKARTLARELQRLQPDQARGYQLEAEVEAKRSNLKAAVALLQQALQKQNSGSGHFRLHQLLLMDGRRAEADAMADDWMRRHPVDLPFLSHLALLAQVNGQDALAEQRYRRILALAPNDAEALNNLAMLLVKLRKPGARELSARALQLRQGNPDYLDTMASIHAQQSEWREAVDFQTRAVTVSPRSASLHLTLIRYLVAAGRMTEARSELRKTTELRLPMSDADKAVAQELSAKVMH